jgi:hypothetical protein
LYHLQIANLRAQTNSFVSIYSVIIKISSALTLTTAARNNIIQLKLLSPKISSFIISIEEEGADIKLMSFCYSVSAARFIE